MIGLSAILIILASTCVISGAEVIMDGTNYNFRTINSLNRSFVLYVPEKHRNQGEIIKLPLLVGLHGTDGNGLEFSEYSELMISAERSEEFIVIFPNGGDCYGYLTLCNWDAPQNDYTTRDISFLENLIEDFVDGNVLPSNLQIDENKIILLGHSLGAFFSYYFVQSSKKREVSLIITYAGFAEIWLNELDSYFPPYFKSNLLHIHGELDDDEYIQPGMDDSINFFLSDVLGCSPSEIGEKEIETDCDGDYILTKYKNTCPLQQNGNQFGVRSLVMSNLGHSWWHKDFGTCSKTKFCSNCETFADVIWEQAKDIIGGVCNNFETSETCPTDCDTDCDPICDPEHGICSNGTCICDSTRHGDWCQNIIYQGAVCNGIPSEDPTTCSGHGSCSESGCFCNTGYTGEFCANEEKLDDNSLTSVIIISASSFCGLLLFLFVLVAICVSIVILMKKRKTKGENYEINLNSLSRPSSNAFKERKGTLEWKQQ